MEIPFPALDMVVYTTVRANTNLPYDMILGAVNQSRQRRTSTCLVLGYFNFEGVFILPAFE
jgi:hypothetical protein